MMEAVTVARPERSTSTVQAAIDIGTNSIHLVVARIDDTGRFDIVTREKATVRLGHGSGEMSELAPATRSSAASRPCVAFGSSPT